eukprot:CAMPEP_0172025420 /NCGR_PEP_ID=MMETSP1041-20130122/15887_1 /TAXON_ID=464988 /ORGANISM="Hemiselmis andersenii, Strain CCMP439" /LENGTH=112 /DNA_ID=CAMNT_0012681113 /DNA_START=28 /DNA_END=363 /DNA_ORIENTATION=+
MPTNKSPRSRKKEADISAWREAANPSSFHGWSSPIHSLGLDTAARGSLSPSTSARKEREARSLLMEQGSAPPSPSTPKSPHAASRQDRQATPPSRPQTSARPGTSDSGRGSK